MVGPSKEDTGRRPSSRTENLQLGSGLAMNVRLLRSLVLVIAAVLAAIACNNPTPEGPECAPPAPDPSTYSRQIDSYVAVAPRVLRSGQTHNITASLFQGKEPGSARTTNRSNEH